MGKIVGIFNCRNSADQSYDLRIKHRIFKTIQPSNLSIINSSDDLREGSLFPPNLRTHLLVANPDQGSPISFILVTDKKSGLDFSSTIEMSMIGNNQIHITDYIDTRVPLSERPQKFPWSVSLEELRESDLKKLEQEEPEITTVIG